MDNTARIRQLNDELRTTLEQQKGKVMLTAGVAELDSDVLARLLRQVATFNGFDGDNDPHGEHDFGAIELTGIRFFWKIDYYDAELKYGSDNPADPAQTTRVLTIMRADEY